jgi:glycosyltransferase involved in cell wall biosynthesis
MQSFISVIIPCYNQARFLAGAVDSALSQDYPAKEVIVINDGSPDNAREVASRFGDRIVYIEQENKGVSAARNRGIIAARGDYIAFLDSDDVYLPGALSILASYLNAHPETALVCANGVLVDGSGVIGLKSAVSGRPKNSVNFRRETVSYCATTSTVMLRRSCVDSTGLFVETLKKSGEDWLMWIRISLRFDMAYLDTPVIRYRLHGTSTTANTERLTQGNREAVALAVNDPSFLRYPAPFRARLLFYRFATTWRVEPKRTAFRYLVKALAADPLQIPFGLRVLCRGATNALRRKLGRRARAGIECTLP